MESSAALALFPWRQLGALLADEGLLTDTELELALDEQRRTGRLLGQIVVDRGYVSAFSLARVLSAQHGVELTGELEATLKPAPSAEPVYRVYSVTFRQGFQQRSCLWESANFLEAADFAMEFVQDHEPEALEIERIDGDQQETVWTYSETRAAAAELARKDLVDTFGFDPTRWDPNR